MNDEVWTVADIAAYLKINVKTVRRSVLCRPAFPKGFRPTGSARGERRWFAEDVREWARQAA